MLLVHVVGEADLGVLQWEGDARLPEERLVERVCGRRARLSGCATGREVASLLGLEPEPSGGSSETFFPHPETLCGTLRAELEAVADLLCERGAPGDESVSLLLVGAEEGDRATGPIARCLVDALRLAGAVPSRLVDGRAVEVLDAVVVPGLQKVARRAVNELEAAIGAYDGHVVLALAGGATTIVAETAGVIASTHGDEWTLLHLGRAAGQHVAVDMSVDTDPLQGWLMGLGLPSQVPGASAPVPTDAEQADTLCLDAEIRRAAASIRRATDPGSENTTHSEQAADLRLLVQCDTARGDLAAGMSLRAWVVAEYRRRLEEYCAANGLDPKGRDVTMKGGQLGRILRSLERQKREGEISEPEMWLLSHKHLNELGKKGTHDFADARSVDGASSYHDEVRCAVGEPPSWLSWPSPQVCLLSGQGRAARNGRVSIYETVLSEEPSEYLRRACAVDGALRLSAFIACSSFSLADGQRVKSMLDGRSQDAWTGWTYDADGTTVHDYGDFVTEKGVIVRDADTRMAPLRQAALAWLEGREERPRAVVVTVLGEKPVAISLLAAAQRYGARHGVPVFLMSAVTDGGGDEVRELMQFHQFGLDRDVRQALLDVVGYCLNRLDLRTAERLLALGDPAMGELADSARGLADELVIARPNERVDECAGTVLDVLSHVADTIDGVPEDAKVRLATIVGELAAKARKGWLSGASSSSSQGDSTRRDSCGLESAAVLLGRFATIRNKLPVTHGRMNLNEAVEHVLQNASSSLQCGYACLLKATVAAVRKEYPDVPQSDWGERIKGLKRKVDDLKKRGYGAAHE